MAKKEPTYLPGTINQANALIEASYRLNLEEKRLLLCAVKGLDSRKPVPKEITISAEEYMEAFGLNPKNAYKQLKSAMDTLSERWIKFYGDDNLKMEYRWLEGKGKYVSGEGRVILVLSEKVRPLLGELEKNYRGYRLAHVRKIKSVYAIRLYELLNQYQDTGIRIIPVEKLRFMLGLNEEYPRFTDFNRFVLKPALKELSTKSNFDVSMKVERKNQVAVTVVFTFTEKDQGELELE